jgi:hypothetical protein
MTDQRKLLTRDDILKQMAGVAGETIRHVEDSSGARVMIDQEKESLYIRPTRGAHTVEVETKQGLPNILRVVGLPLNIAKNLSPGTFSACLSEMLQHEGNFSMVLADNQVTDIIPFKSRMNLPIERVLNTVEKAMPVQGYNRAMVINPHYIQLEIVGEKTEPVAVGDLVQAGVMLRFSTLNIQQPAVQSYALRLACTNGMTTGGHWNEHAGSGGGGEGDDIWQWFRQNVRKSYHALDKVVTGWKRMVEEKIDPKDRAAMLEALIKEAHLNPEAADAIRSMALEDPPTNNWELMNLVTYASSHILTEPKEVVRAQKAASTFIDESQHMAICPVCHAAHPTRRHIEAKDVLQLK